MSPSPDTLRLTAAALLLALLAACTNPSTTGADADVAPAADTFPVNALSLQAEAIDGMTTREIGKNAYLKKLFVQNDRILRYQLQFYDVPADAPTGYPTFLKMKPRVLELMARDTIAAEVLRGSSSIYVDVYNTDDILMFSYDLKPSDIFEGAVDPEPL